MKFTSQDRVYMQMAIDLARKGFGKTQPNPLVGAVIVRGGKVVGTGYHMKYGGAHAEVNALREAGVRARGATVYVTLDSCRHVGKTGPCTEALIRAGVARVISACDDPHDAPHEGEKILKRAGIIFSRGLLGDESRRVLLQPYLKWVTRELPYVILKVATTLDGKIGTASGVSRGITSSESLKEVHRMRASVDAVLTGSGTAMTDNPHLGVRHVKGRDPLRVLLDSSLTTPVDALIFRDTNCVVFTTDSAPVARVRGLRSRGAEVVSMGASLELLSVLKALFARGVYLLMIEAGSTLMTSFLHEGLVDRYVQFIAPKLLGGENSPTSFEGEDPVDFGGVVKLEHVEYTRLGDNMKVEGMVKEY